MEGLSIGPNARATTQSSAYIRADVVLLKLHCRPNDLDCWVETLLKCWLPLNRFTVFIHYIGGWWWNTELLHGWLLI